jgi:hypothetical protein
MQYLKVRGGAFQPRGRYLMYLMASSLTQANYWGCCVCDRFRACQHRAFFVNNLTLLIITGAEKVAN